MTEEPPTMRFEEYLRLGEVSTGQAMKPTKKANSSKKEKLAQMEIESAKAALALLVLEQEKATLAEQIAEEGETIDGEQEENADEDEDEDEDEDLGEVLLLSEYDEAGPVVPVVTTLESGEPTHLIEAVP